MVAAALLLSGVGHHRKVLVSLLAETSTQWVDQVEVPSQLSPLQSVWAGWFVEGYLMGLELGPVIPQVNQQRFARGSLQLP
jgi:hypothetical protein